MSAALENAIVRRLEDPAQARSERIRARTVRHIRQQVANETRLLSADPAASFVLSLCNRVFGVVQSSPPRPHFAQLAALELVDALLEIPAASNETVLIRVAHALRMILQQAGATTNDPLVLQAAAAALGHLARLGSPLTLDLVNFQVKQAFEWLQQSTTVGAASSNTAAELRELAAVLVLKQLAANAPTLFNPHVPMFLDLVWVPIHAMRVDVREAAVLALRVCLMDMASRAERWKRSCYLRIFEQAQAGIRPAESRGGGSRSSGVEERKTSESEVLSPTKVRNRSETSAHVTARIHGSLLVLGELLDHASSDFMAPRFRLITDLIMQHRQHPSKTIQRTVMSLLPRVAKLSSDEFRREDLKDVVAYLSLHMDSDQRDVAFLALGRLAASVTDGLLPSLPSLMTQISSSVSITIGMLPVTSAPPSSTKTSSFFGFSLFGRKDEPESEPAAEPNADRNRRLRRYTSTAMGCIGMLAAALGETITALLQPQIDVMLQTGLSQALIDTLSSIGQHLPSLLPLIQDRLLDLLSVLLQQASTLSQPRSRTPNPAASPSASPSPSSFYSFGFKSGSSSSAASASEKMSLYSAPSSKVLQAALPDGRVPVVFLSPASRLAAIRTPAEVCEHDRAAILLALRTLASFDWRGQEIVVLALSREVLTAYLQEAEDEIRLQAAVTLSSLMRLLAHAFVHTASSAAVFDLLKTLVALSISDASASIRLSILTSFSALSSHSQTQQPMLHSADGQGASAVLLQLHEQHVLDTHLCQSEILSSLALCLNDESFAIRERVVALLSSLAPRNSMLILPILRSFLIQLLHSLQHQPDDMDDSGSEALHAYQADASVEAGWEEPDGVSVLAASPSSLAAVSAPIPLSEQHAKLLLTLISYPGGEKLCRSYAHAILQVLLPKLTHILTMHGGAGRRPQPALLTSLSTAASAALSSLPRSSQLASYILSTLGKLSILAGADMRPSISLLLDLIIDTLSDASLSGGAPSAAVVVAPDEEETMLKRTVAIRTLGQLITSTGNVIDPYLHYPSLLPTLLRLLQEERASGRGTEMARGKRSAGMLITDGDDGLGASHVDSAFSLSTYFLTSTSQREFRLELLKLLAKLGALNPYRFRHSPTLLALQSVESHHHASLSGAPPPPTAPGLGSVHFLDTEPLLSDLMAQAESEGIDAHTILHEEYFPSVALRALLRLLLQPRLSHLHVLVLRAALFIFRSLGAAKSAQYLPAVMPLILSQMTQLATHSMNLTAVGAGPVGFDSAAGGPPSLASSSSAKSLSSLASSSQLGDATAGDVTQLQLAYLQHLISITQIVHIGMRPFLPQIFQILFVGHTYAAAAPNGESSVAHAPSVPSLQLPYWSSPALTSSILRLIEVVSLSLRAVGGDDDFKLTYQPLVMSKLLQLLQHADQNLAASGATSSPMSRQTHLHPAHATHLLLLKMLHTLQVLGGSGRDALTEFLHTLLPTLMRIAERSLQQIPKDPPHARMPRGPSPPQSLQTPASASTGYQLSVAVIQTLSVLAHLHDCSLHASRLIHVLCRFFRCPGLRPSSLTESCLELLCVLMAQLGFDFLLFYEKLLSGALKPLIRKYEELGFGPLNTHAPASSLSARSPRINSAISPQQQQQQQQQQHRRDLSNSSNEGSISSTSSPPGSDRAQQPVPRRSPSVLALSSSADLSAAPPANNLQRFQSMLSQLKQRVEQVQVEKQLPRASEPWLPAGSEDPSTPPSSSSAAPNLSSKDFFHLPLFDSMDVPAVERAPSLEIEVDGLSLSNSTSRNTSYTDLSSLAEHDSDTESLGGGSPSITAVNSGPKKLRMSQPNLLRAWTANARSTKDDWAVWMRGFSLELLKESPSPSLRACSFLAQKFPALAQTLFNAAFLACWPELTDAFQDDLISNLEFIFAKGQPPTRGVKMQQKGAQQSASSTEHAQSSTPNRSQAPSPSPSTTPRRVSSPGPGGRGSTSAVPSSIVTALLNLCEFMEHMECTLPINIGLLSALSVRCHAFATALHYQEIEFHQTAAATQLATIAASPSDTNLSELPRGQSSDECASIQAAEATIESLITISNKLGQKAAADGILKLMRSQQMAAIQQARRNAMQRDAQAELVTMRQAQILIKPIWFERLQRWEDALEAYEQRQDELLQAYACSPPTSPSVRTDDVASPDASPDDRMDFEGRGEYIELMLGKMRCLRALGEWEQLASIAQAVWNRTDDPVVRRELCPLAAAAACNLHRWDSMAPLMLYFDEDGSAAAAAAASSPLSSRTSSGAMARGSDRRHRFDTNYYSAIFLVHKERFGEARNYLDRAVEVLDPQLTALVGESYSRAYKSLLLLQRVAQLEEIIDFKLSGPKSASSSSGSPLTPRQVLLQRMWSSRMLGGLSRGGEDIEAWGELLMQQQLLRAPGSSYYNEHNLDLYLEWCEICRKASLSMGTAATDVPLASMALSGEHRTQNPFLKRSERVLHNMIGFSPLELLPDATGTSAGLVSSSRRLQQLLETTRPRTKLPHLLFAIWKNLYAQGYRVQSLHRLKDMVAGSMDNDVFPRALREASAQTSNAALAGVMDPYSNLSGTFLGVTELEQLRALCYIRLGKWQMSMLDESLSQRVSTSAIDIHAPRTPYSPFPNSSSFTFSYPAPVLASASSAAPPLSASAQSLHEILDFFRLSTVLDPVSVRAWHEYGMLQAKICTSWRFLLAPQAAQQAQQQAASSSSSLAPPALLRSISNVSVPMPQLTPHIVAAIHAFFRSISLQPVGDNSLQDILRILALWFEFGASESADEALLAHQMSSGPASPTLAGIAMVMHSPTMDSSPDFAPPSSIAQAMLQGLNLIALDNWLTVIPQLIARIHVASGAIRGLLLELLCRVGRAHPQALIYPLTVASKSLLESRRRSAVDVLDHMRTHSGTLVSQAAMVSTQLVRVAILWYEMFHEGLEEASRHWFGSHDFPAMMRVLEPLHALLTHVDGLSIREAAFVNTYGRELAEALEYCRRYERAMYASKPHKPSPSSSPPPGSEEAKSQAKSLAQESQRTASYMNRAWEIYTSVFRKLHKQAQSTHELELSDISPQLLLSRDLELAVPGSYRAGAPVVRISLIEPLLRIIDSKQHPRRLGMLGSDGVSYPFLLKGHEDLRQDERVMQLFGLVNTLLVADHATAKSDLSIRRYAVVPLSPNSGLIEWVPNSDPMHTTIKRYRDARCLRNGTLVRLASGGSIPCESVTAADMLVGANGLPVRVASVQPNLPRREIWHVNHDRQSAAYSVSSNHRLTLVCQSNPAITLSSKPDADGTYSMQAHCMTPDGRWTSSVDFCWECEVLDADPTENSLVHEFAVFDDAALARLAFLAEDATLASHALPMSLSSATQFRKRHRGTRAQLLQEMRNAFFSRPRCEYLLAGDLFEMTPADLLKAAGDLQLGGCSPRAAGVRVPEAGAASSRAAAPASMGSNSLARVTVPCSAEFAHEAVAAEAHRLDPDHTSKAWTSIALAQGMYDSVQYGVDTASIVYMLHHPLSTDRHELDAFGNQSIIFSHLEQCQRELGIDVSRKQGIIVTELNPIAALTDEIKSEHERYRTLCALAVDHALSYGTDRMLVFGAAARLRWLQEAETRSSGGAWLNVRLDWEDGVRTLSFMIACSRRAVKVFFSVHPSLWVHKRAIVRAMAAAHGVPFKLAEETINGAVQLANPPVTRVAAPVLVTNIEIEGQCDQDRRFVLGDGFVTHNSILLNIEQRLMVKFAPDYNLCTVVQKVEVLQYALSMTTGLDLARVMWLHAPTAEAWLDRRTTFTSSTAVMCMVGYILGLGDRHTCNILLERHSGACVHIDFGDCFEVSMQRDKFPERVPFRLTRMIVNAFEVAGIEGTFRNTSEKCMRVLRKNKNSIMAVLEAFSLDPLLNWRLLDVGKKRTNTGGASAGAAATTAPTATSQLNTMPPPAPNNRVAVASPVAAAAVSSSQQQLALLLAPLAAPHSHVNSAIAPLLAERALNAQQQQAQTLAQTARNAMDPVVAPTSILGMLLHIPTEQRHAAHTAAAAVPTAVPAVPLPTASTAHSKAEATIVAGAAEPGFGSKTTHSGPLGAVDEGDEDGNRVLPPSPAHHRRSVLDESVLAVSNNAGASSTAQTAASAAAVHSRLEQLNQQAQAVMTRVESKLKGTEWAAELSASSPTAASGAGATTRVVGFAAGHRALSDSASSSSSFSPSPAPTVGAAAAAPLTVAAQVQRLIEEATSHVNLAQAYIGWCPFW